MTKEVNVAKIANGGGGLHTLCVTSEVMQIWIKPNLKDLTDFSSIWMSVDNNIV